MTAPDPAWRAPGFRKSLKEFAIASLIHLLCLAWIFRGAILAHGVDPMQQHLTEPPQALVNMSEMVYEVQSAVFAQTRLIKQGIFPSWSPYSQGGTPLIGKMQNAVFAPYHVPLYVLPLGWMPYLLTLVVCLKVYLAFAFAYLYARSLRLSLPGGIFAGTIFACLEVVNGGLFSWSGSGLYMPLLLLLVELYFRGHRALAQLLLPWAAALPWFGGHFESAFWLDLACSVYFFLRLWPRKDITTHDKINRSAVFIGLMLTGAALAVIQVAPAAEYVGLSYNKIWHDPRWFGFWDLETVYKHLSMEDAPLLAAGWAALGGFSVFMIKILRSQSSSWKPRRIVLYAAAAAALGLAIGCLVQVGLDASLQGLVFRDADSLICWPFSLFLIFFAFREWSQTDEPGSRVLGSLMLAGMILISRVPPFSNVILNAPGMRNFHNAQHRWEVHLALGVLAAAGLERCWKSRAPQPQRLQAFGRALTVAAILLVGYFLSEPLQNLIAARVPTGLKPALPGQEQAGGFMGPERQATFGKRWTAAGWIPAAPAVAAVELGLLRGNEIVYKAPAVLESSPDRVYFHGELPLREAGGFTVVAQAHLADGRSRDLRGPDIQARRRSASAAGDWIIAASFLAFLLLIVSPLPVVGAAAAAALLVILASFPRQSLPSDHIPYRLAGIADIQKDGELFRGYSLQYNFLQADYLDAYGLSDLRTGGDNLDVLTTIYFTRLAGSFLADPRNAPAFDTGLRLLGLGNVKYLIEIPQTSLPAAALAEVYRGPDMTVFRNRHFLPRVAFYDHFIYMPIGNWQDWATQGRFLGPLARILQAGQIDPGQTLVLNDAPSSDSQPPAADHPSGQAAVRIVDYRPDRVRIEVAAPRQGFVFLSDNYFPGWRAVLNGRQAPILRSWITFRAVAVPAGKSSLEFIYKPWPLRAATALALLAVVAWLWLYPGLRPALSPAMAPMPAPKKKKSVTTEPPEDLGERAGLAALTECGVLVLAGSIILFWSLWSVFIYKGGVQRLAWNAEGFPVNLLATFLLLGLGARWMRKPRHHP
jgi:hypothetical protein